MEGKRCHFFCRMVHVLRVIATGILSPLYLSNINVKSIRSRVPNIFHTPVLPPGGFCRTRRRAPPGRGRRFTAAPLLSTASLPRVSDGSARPQHLQRENVQGETKMISGDFAAVPANPEKQKV